jgi:hypothetical protein
MEIERPVSTIDYWMGKFAGALKKPRPVHIKKEPAGKGVCVVKPSRQKFK